MNLQVRQQHLTEQREGLLYTEKVDSLDEPILPLTAAARALLAQHQADKRGRCNRQLLPATLLVADLFAMVLSGHGSNRAAVVDLLQALANPCWEARRLLAMADTWRTE